MITPHNFNFLRDLSSAPQSGIEIVASPVQTVEELRAAMAELSRIGGGAAIMTADAFIFAHLKEAATFSLHYRLPTISVFGYT
jgi:hypothetical protein